MTNELIALASSNGTTQADLVPAVNQLVKLVDIMRSDVQQINSRINLLERSLADVKNDQLRKKVTINIDILNYTSTTKLYVNKSNCKIGGLKYPKWWPFAEISPTWFILMLAWPFVAQRLISAMQRKKWPRTLMLAIESPPSSKQQLQQQQLHPTDDENDDDSNNNNRKTTNDSRWKFTCITSYGNTSNCNVHSAQGRCHRRRYFLNSFVHNLLQLLFLVWL